MKRAAAKCPFRNPHISVKVLTEKKFFDKWRKCLPADADAAQREKALFIDLRRMLTQVRVMEILKSGQTIRRLKERLKAKKAGRA